jgi:hypothetical protein
MTERPKRKASTPQSHLGPIGPERINLPCS